MGVSTSLIRLCDLRRIEEQQQDAELATAVAESRQLENSLRAASERVLLARESFQRGLGAGKGEERFYALQDIASLERLRKALIARFSRAEGNIREIRNELLRKRMNRRQVETLIEKARADVESGIRRQTQTAVDEWYRSRARRPDR